MHIMVQFIDMTLSAVLTTNILFCNTCSLIIQATYRHILTIKSGCFVDKRNYIIIVRPVHDIQLYKQHNVPQWLRV